MYFLYYIYILYENGVYNLASKHAAEDSVNILMSEEVDKHWEQTLKVNKLQL